VQAQVLNLMQDLSQQFGVTYLLISHDLAVVDHVCDEVAVIYQGRIVEQGSPVTLFREAAHPYTQALLAAVPRATPNPGAGGRRRSVAITSRPHPASACPYAPRCPQAQALCDQQRPELASIGEGHRVACHFGSRLVAPNQG
jgi:peptide/nickel transport system ATP-binding protein